LVFCEIILKEFLLVFSNVVYLFLKKQTSHLTIL